VINEETGIIPRLTESSWKNNKTANKSQKSTRLWSNNRLNTEQITKKSYYKDNAYNKC
jgi:hypothetical protein